MPPESSRIATGLEWRNSSLNKEETENSDAELIALGRTFEALSAELAILQREEVDKPSVATEPREQLTDDAANTPSVERIEALLRSLEPIERAIMAMPAMTVVGLGVKARHAAHVLSHYWTRSPERLDWDERTVCLLIESTCAVAGVPLLSSQQRDSK